MSQQRLALVVDDQTELNQQLAEFITIVSPGWQGLGVNLPANAIKIAQEKQPELVICDQQMPGMLGNECLGHVRDVSPQSMRILMSGALDSQTIAKSAAHQQLLKPISGQSLEDAIQRTIKAQKGLSRTGLATLVPALRSLPMLPHVYQQLRRELHEEVTTTAALAEIIATDPGLSSRVLHLANSAAFHHDEVVSNPKDAVFFLGTDVIETMVLSQQIYKTYQTSKRQPLPVERVWDYSWQVAQRARNLCREWGMAELAETAFLAGMLMEIGTLVILDNFPERLSKANKSALENKIPYQEAIKEEFGGSSREMSFYIMELWGLPEIAADAVLEAYHTNKRRGQPRSLADVMYVADQETWRKALYFDAPPFAWDERRMQEVGYEIAPAEASKITTQENNPFVKVPAPKGKMGRFLQRLLRLSNLNNSMSLNLGLTLRIGQEHREVPLRQTPTNASLQIAPDRQIFGKEPGLSRYLKWFATNVPEAKVKPPSAQLLEQYLDTAQALRAQNSEEEAKYYEDLVSELKASSADLSPLELESNRIYQVVQEFADAYQITPNKVQWRWSVS